MATEEAKDIQRRMYEFIVKYIKTEGMPPTNREIGREMNIASTGHVDYYLTMLEKQGLISRQQKKSRGIRLLLRSPLIHKVTVIGSIIGGQSLETFSEPNGHINVEADLAQKGNYALLVKGNSMIDEGIHDGDYVVIDPQFPYENGDIIVALHLQEGTMDSPTIKRFYREKEQNRIRLEPVNSELNLIYIPMSKWDHEWQIQGKVLAIVRQSNSEKENPALSTYPSGSTAEKDVEATITALRDATNKLNELINQKTAELLSAKQISST